MLIDVNSRLLGRTWKLVALVLLACFASFLTAAAPPIPAAPKPDITLESPGDSFSFIGYGDTRFMPVSDMQHSNPLVRVSMVEKIAKEKPVFVAVVGDIVHVGANALEWLQYDRETKIWRDQKIIVLPVLGNHDVNGGEAAALPNYFQRFPLVDSKRWYSARCGSVQVLALDTTSDHGPGSQQWTWLDANLAAIPNSVDFVLINLHHPPYTQSADNLGGHSARKEEQALAAMIEKHQAQMRARIIVIAGHVHNYERYERGGVMYIVSGGGGAPPYMVERKSTDFYREDGATYHYCRFQVERGRLRAEMVKYIDPDHWAVKDQFEMSVVPVIAPARETSSLPR
jgi:Icc-related predicted phosphoesterase